MMRHVNNVSYLRWAETSRTEFFAEVLGEDILSSRGMILAKLGIDYVKPLAYRENVAIGCRVTRLGNKSFRDRARHRKRRSRHHRGNRSLDPRRLRLPRRSHDRDSARVACRYRRIPKRDLLTVEFSNLCVIVTIKRKRGATTATEMRVAHRDRRKRRRRLVEIEHVGEIVRTRIRRAEPRDAENLVAEFHDASVLVLDARDIPVLSVTRNND